jgi:extracellular elastinolytic metalloproteinase
MRFHLYCLFTVFILSTDNLTAQNRKDPVRLFVEKQLTSLHLNREDFSDAAVNDDYTSGGFRYVYYQQEYRGVKVFNAILNVVVPPSGNIQISGNRFVPNILEKTKSQEVSISSRDALKAALDHLGISYTGDFIAQADEQGKRKLYRKTVYKAIGSVEEDIPAELVWTVLDQRVELSWNIRIRLKSDWWEIRVSALNGEVLEKNNWFSHCVFDAPQTQPACDEPAIDQQDAIMGANDYEVFDIPLESPAAGGRTVVNSPWNRAGQGNNAVSLQWHNDGTNSYTNTRGNNVFAKDDIAADNESTIGYSPNSPDLDFVFPFTVGAAASVNRDAAITNLFFWNNLCHDIFYQYGFDEASGNFQRNNQGRGGSGNDFVFADAMDGSGTNNANFATPPDGSSPRMQMFLWNASGASSTFKVNSPQNLAGNYAAGTAIFNPSSPTSITGNLILSTPANGCSALTNPSAVAGKIAVIDRGTCTFVTKVKNAQNAGAIGVVIVNNVAGAPITMSGTDPTINILSCMVSNTTGTQLKSGIQSGTVNGTIQASQSGSASIDADFDNGVIVHEYGHGISNRLTGGRSTSSCLSNAEQMGEGWSDYFALMLCTDWTTAQPNDARAIGNYVIGQSLAGGGIRDYPYSYDMTISPYNYNFARSNTAVHDLGSAWAAMLWDLTWNIIALKPASSDLYQGQGGNNIALRLVMEGLKLQPCSPGFVDGRDAILKADELLYNSTYRCAIWNAFARRGLGLSASQGSRNSASDGSQAFNAPQGLDLRIQASGEMLAPGDTVDFALTTLCECTENKGLQLNATLSSKLDYVSSNGTFNPVDRKISFSAFDLQVTERDTQVIRTVVNNSFPQPTLQFADDAESGSSKWNSVHLGGTGFPSFTIGNNNARSGTRAWFIPAVTQPSQTAMVMSSPLTIMPESWLSFWHTHRIEPDYDGGVLEISINNGTSWQDLGSRMTRNGYNGTIAITDNSLQGRSVFTGETAMRQTVVNLADFSGEDALIRFRYGSDTQNGALPNATGWFIDDIQLTYNDTCILVRGEVGNQTNTATANACVSIKAVDPVITDLQSSEEPLASIYPNPAQDRVWISTSDTQGELQARVLTITGQELRSVRISGYPAVEMDLNNLPAAPYLVEVISGDRKQLFRLIKF